MATRRKPQRPASAGPRGLYYGLLHDTFRWYGYGDARSAASKQAREEWTDKVYAAGYTELTLRKVAMADPAFCELWRQNWREFKRRLCSEHGTATHG